MAMPPVTPASHISGGASGSKGSGVVREVVGVCDWLAGSAVNRQGGNGQRREG